jgi:hypothetical protein
MLDEDLPRVLEAYFAVDEHRRMCISVAEGEEMLSILSVRTDAASLTRSKSQPDDDAAVVHLRRTALSAHLALAANEPDLIGSLLEPSDVLQITRGGRRESQGDFLADGDLAAGPCHTARKVGSQRPGHRSGSFVRHGSVSSVVGFDLSRQYSQRRSLPGAQVVDTLEGARGGTTPSTTAIPQRVAAAVAVAPLGAVTQQSSVPRGGGGHPPSGPASSHHQLSQQQAQFPISFLSMMRLMFPSYPRKVVEKVVLGSLPAAPQIPPRVVVDDTATLLFRRCRALSGNISDSDRGTISQLEIANGCRSLGMDERQLEQLVLRSSSHMKTAMLLDIQLFETRRVVDVLNHVGLPGYALLAQPQKYSPPLSMVNLLCCWDMLRPQLITTLNSRQETRLSQLYVFAKQYGMPSVFKVQWGSLLPPPPPLADASATKDDGAWASPMSSPLGGGGSQTPFELSTNGSVTASMEIGSTLRGTVNAALLADPVPPQGIDIVTDLNVGVDGAARRWSPPASDSIRLSIDQLALLISIPRRAGLQVMPVVAPTSVAGTRSGGVSSPTRRGGAGGGGTSSAGGSRSASALGMDDSVRANPPMPSPPKKITPTTSTRDGGRARRMPQESHPVISGFRKFGELETPEAIFSALASVVASANDADSGDVPEGGVGTDHPSGAVTSASKEEPASEAVVGEVSAGPKHYPSATTMRLRDKLIIEKRCKRDVGNAFNVPFIKQVQGLSVFAHMKQVASGVYPRAPPSVDTPNRGPVATSSPFYSTALKSKQNKVEFHTDDYVVLSPRIETAVVTKLSSNERRHTPQLFNFSCNDPPLVPIRPLSARPLPQQRDIGDRSLCHVVLRPHAAPPVATGNDPSRRFSSTFSNI